ncbi:MAG: hypothetical protein M3R00_03300 [Pseudomonadota bacterium]|nr:hypothetical protein [Pseudomonadota bacterium]
MNKLMMSTLIATALFTGVAFASPDTANQTSNSLMKLQVIQTQIELTKSSFKSVKLLSPSDGKYSVSVELTPSAEKQIQQLTRNNIDHAINFVWNKQILSTAAILSPIGGNFQISGLTLQEAESFVKSIQKELTS